MLNIPLYLASLLVLMALVWPSNAKAQTQTPTHPDTASLQLAEDDDTLPVEGMAVSEDVNRRGPISCFSEDNLGRLYKAKAPMAQVAGEQALQKCINRLNRQSTHSSSDVSSTLVACYFVGCR